MSLVKNEKIEANKVELHFTLEAEAFKTAISKAYRKEAKNFNVPGFRKGKAPRNLIETMYGAEVFHLDAINDLFPDAYEAIIIETGLEPVDRPEVDVVSADVENGVVVKVIVTVKPEVKIGEYKGLKVEKNVNTIKDEEVDQEIERMADRNSRMITREGDAQNGDSANINFEGFVADVAFEGGKGENFDLVLGSGQFIPGFEEQVVGHKAGDAFDVTVTFPEQYQAEDLAGKEAIFKCTINELKTKELPVMDDEFAKDVSEFDTLEELKSDIRKGMQEQADKKVELDVENAIVDLVVDSLEAEVPECMNEARIDEMVREFEMRLDQQGLKLDMYIQYTGATVESFREGFKEQAEKQVKIRLALEKIVELENIVAEEADIEAEIVRIAEAYKMEVEKVRGLIPLDEVKKDLTVNKAIDLLKSTAVITEIQA